MVGGAVGAATPTVVGATVGAAVATGATVAGAVAVVGAAVAAVGGAAGATVTVTLGGLVVVVTTTLVVVVTTTLEVVVTATVEGATVTAVGATTTAATVGVGGTVGASVTGGSVVGGSVGGGVVGGGNVVVVLVVTATFPVTKSPPPAAATGTSTIPESPGSAPSVGALASVRARSSAFALEFRNGATHRSGERANPLAITPTNSTELTLATSSLGMLGKANNRGPTAGQPSTVARTPAAIARRLSDMASNALTTVGSNCVPDWELSSSRAAVNDRCSAYVGAAVITANASATATIRALRLIC